VTVTVTPPSGKAATLSGTPASNHVAVLYYQLSRQAERIVYRHASARPELGPVLLRARVVYGAIGVGGTKRPT
jgi:hypothetical protein